MNELFLTFVLILLVVIVGCRRNGDITDVSNFSYAIKGDFMLSFDVDGRQVSKFLFNEVNGHYTFFDYGNPESILLIYGVENEVGGVDLFYQGEVDPFFKNVPVEK